MKCSDCQAPAREMTDKVRDEGSTVREPGEGLCPGCSSRRVLMVRELDRMPSNLQDIQAKRMVRV